MSAVIVNDDHLVDIANAIRSKLGNSEKLQTFEMAGAIEKIENTPAEPHLQNKVVDPAIVEQSVIADIGYDGLGNVTVNPVTSSIDSNIKAENIVKGVSILGVSGTVEPSVEVIRKYKPKYITFRDCTVADLTEETKMLDTSLLTSMKQILYSANIEKVDLSEWDTSNCTDMSYMFYYASNLQDVNLSSFNTSKVTNMSYMFSNCKTLKNIDISNFDTSKVTTMKEMFTDCEYLNTLNISGLTNNVLTDIEEMFSYCRSLKNFDGTNFNTSNVTKMYGLFQVCTSLQQVNISTWDLSKSTSYSSMFAGCNNLQKIDMRGTLLNTSALKNSMFSQIPKNCLIIVKGETEKSFVLSAQSDLTNVKTLAEYQAEGGV